MEGWVKLHRRSLKWEWQTEPLTAHLFRSMLLMTNHEDKKWRGIEIKKGQFVSSIKQLSKKTGISPRSVRTSIDRLKSTRELTSEPTSEYTVFTIVNYDEYQGRDSEPTQGPTRDATNDRQTTDKRPTSTKEEKEIKEYYYTAEIVRLTKPDYDNFRKVCPSLSVDEYEAQLHLADRYYVENGGEKWFFRLSGWLTRANADKKKTVKEDPSRFWRAEDHPGEHPPWA